MGVFASKVIGLYETLNRGCTPSDILDRLYKEFREDIPFERVSIVLTNNEGQIYLNELRHKKASNMLQGRLVDAEDTSLSEVFRRQEPRIINDYQDYFAQKPSSELTAMLLEEGIRSSMAYPLVVNGIGIGALIFASSTPNAYNGDLLAKARILANILAVAVEKTILVDDLILASITGLAKLVEAKDSETGLHLQRIQNYSKIIAEQLSTTSKYQRVIDEQFIEDIYKFSPLHDIGKVGIADGILLKPAKLTEEEFAVMKRHTVIGAEVLKKSSNNLLRRGRHFFDMAIQIALGHHEKYDGTGYPYGLAGEAIPLSARIVSLADVFDALTSKRVYKQSIDIDVSFKMVADESGSHFDPDIVQAMLDRRLDIIEICELYKENIEPVW
ncbi:MAG TPA: HD domain-containing phosphohydrolase [Bacillota bacterium]|nr:HD domain-containing phosphohydrolase [Bacillota bacterium]